MIIEGWDEKEPLHLFEDGAGIFKMMTVHDRQRQCESCTLHCIHRAVWDLEYFPRGLQLYTMRSREGIGLVTILLGDAVKTIEARTGTAHASYETYTVGDQRPRLLADVPVIGLQFCPKNSLGTRLEDPSAKRAFDWFEALPVPEGILGEYHPDATRLRSSTMEFARRLKAETELADLGRAA